MNSLLLARLEPCILPQSIGHDKVPTFFWGPLFGPGVVRKIWKVASLRDNENLCATQRPPLIFLHDLDPDGCMVRGSTGHYCFVTILYNEITGAKAKPGGDVMELQGKKDKFFITGEVFPLDIGLLMGAECYKIGKSS